MAQWLICPYWECERRGLEDDAGRNYQTDYRITGLHVTNPSDADGMLELAFYEARGDGGFQRADWASGRWSMPAKYQRQYRPDPSAVYGTSFFTYGWFEVWLSRDEMVVDVAIWKITRNTAGGLVESTSQRTVPLAKRSIPLRFRLADLFGSPLTPFNFPPGTVLPGGGGGSVGPGWPP
jgi:hypothetical protein